MKYPQRITNFIENQLQITGKSIKPDPMATESNKNLTHTHTQHGRIARAREKIAHFVTRHFVQNEVHIETLIKRKRKRETELGCKKCN